MSKYFKIRHYVAMWRLGLNPKFVQVISENENKIVFMNKASKITIEYYI